ncbi:diguanylate cyclase [Deinobacterium chartae]|uniref:Diguanylate cyclase n=1 Tax=Deinobacterium chartae TaxID=521158 RepID=A0A841I207_9DEIO|nr:diguanylate cyclase [Deinobacterium chartae]MBB6099727.1 diguanylate cyclase [Deinobacterium chartae]
MEFYPLIFNFCLLVTLTYAACLLYNAFPNLEQRRARLAHIGGAALASVLLMLSPIQLAPGIIADLRTVPLAATALILGPRAALLAALPVLTYRLILGGNGVIVAVLSIASVIVMAALLRHARRRRGQLPWWSVAIIFSVHNLGLLLVPHGPELLLRSYLPINLTNALSLVVVLHMLYTFQRMRELTQMYREQAATDALTGLGNRRQLQHDQPHFKAHDHLLALDIDHFKRINDTFGHGVGDEVLSTLAHLMRASLHPADRAYRVGGEEFLVLLRNTNAAQAEKVAERLRRAVEAHTFINIPFPVTVSLGLLQDVHRFEASRQLELVDQALYAAKRSGRNRLVIAEPPALS